MCKTIGKCECCGEDAMANVEYDVQYNADGEQIVTPYIVDYDVLCDRCWNEAAFDELINDIKEDDSYDLPF